MKKTRIPVYYRIDGTDNIIQDYIIGVSGKGNKKIAHLSLCGGGWNPIDACFLSRKQCIKYHKLDQKAIKNKCFSTLEKIKNIVDKSIISLGV